ncbi:MAG TPA: efflux RND transporter periplasmic adaptor subunit [Candidatus Eisenbacteria bacterium]|jgi:multidrug resistance efflux pump
MPQPKFRADLIVSRQETPEGPYFVVKDPRTRRFFRLREAEYAIARRLDGSSSLEAIAAQVASELGAEVSAETLAPFVEQLRRGDLLESPSDSRVEAARQPWARGNLLWLRFRAFDPDPLLDWLVGKVRFCFTPAFVVGSAALIIWALAVVLSQRAEIGADLASLWSFQSLALAWLTVFAVTALHEFAHGLTCKRFGGHVHEMGFLLIYLQPAFYCNISDAWLFPEKSRRLWVTFAGGYFELVLWALATLVWRIAEHETWLSGVALVVMATSGIKLFFNLNPLIKLDGYYLLSDWLNVPNLRQRAFQYVGTQLKRLLGVSVLVAQEPTPRERRVFLGYGLVAATFSYWLLSSVLVQFAGYFTARWQGWGAALTLGLMVGVMGNVRGKPLLRWPAGLSWKSHRVRFLGFVGAILLLLYLLPLELKVGGEFEVAPARNTDVRAQVAGIIDAVFVAEGDRVAAGDTLAHLSDRDRRTELRMVDAELAEKRAKLQLLEVGPRAEELEVARLDVQKAEERLRYARGNLERNRKLAAIEAASRQELDRAEEAVGVLAKELEGERARLRMLVAGSRPEEITAMREDIAHTDAERRHVQEQLARTWVRAPHGGVVTTPKLRERIGQYVQPGDLIVEVYKLDTVTAEIAIPEQDIGEVRVGQRGAVRLRAYPDRAWQGRVTAVAAAAVELEKQRTRIVKTRIELSNPLGLIKPSMTGYARIYCGKRRALEVLTRPFRRYLRLEFWSWW